MRRTAPPEIQALARMLIDLVGIVRAAQLLDCHHVTLSRMANGERVLGGSIALASARADLFEHGGIAALERAAGLEVES
jgi:hypothetical protein